MIFQSYHEKPVGNFDCLAVFDTTLAKQIIQGKNLLMTKLAYSAVTILETLILKHPWNKYLFFLALVIKHLIISRDLSALLTPTIQQVRQLGAFEYYNSVTFQPRVTNISGIILFIL